MTITTPYQAIVDAAAGTGSLRTIGKNALQAADGADTEFAFSAWKDLSGTPGGMPLCPSAMAAGNYVLAQASLVAIGNGASAAAAFWLDPADYPGGTRVAQIRLRAWIVTNAVAPTVNYTFTLYPVATWGGGSNVDPIIATLGAGGVNAAINTPAANTASHVESASAAFPGAGFYVLVLTTSGLKATNALERIAARLQMRQV